jgi:hypothetical protein
MTAGQVLENVFGVKWEDPAEKLFQSAKKLMQNRTAIGKSHNIAKDSEMPGGMPGAGPRSPEGPTGGNPLEQLMNLGGR